jgi:alpha-ketoglutarate-dependent taurine dioxygenase
MNHGADPKSGPGDLKFNRREPLRLSRENLIETGYLESHEGFPLVIKPAIEHLNLGSWTRDNRRLIEAELIRHGALLFRGFRVSSPSQFELVARATSSELLDYNERAAPRTEVTPKIYTSTEFPPDQYIPLHHEMAHSHNWPMKIWFFCLQPAVQGGMTPIANDREVFHRINPKIKERFMSKRVMYVRNYGEGVDMPWQEVFQTHDRALVEEYCRKSYMRCEWKDNDHVCMRAIRQAVAAHPATGEVVWFNHAHMFHISNLEPVVRDSLRALFKEDQLPRNAFYGDGSPIETSVLDEIRGIYQDAAVRFEWESGDVLMLDNFLASHGREPFAGPRKILVAMAELYTNQEIGM